jgi:hypothetical protein
MYLKKSIKYSNLHFYRCVNKYLAFEYISNRIKKAIQIPMTYNQVYF